MKHILTYLTLYTILISCQPQGSKESVIEYVDNKQRLSLNDKDQYGGYLDAGGLITFGKDTIKVNESAEFKLVVDNPGFKIVKAYFDCNTNHESLIDTVNYNIDGCQKQLFMQNDTIKIYFKPSDLGEKEFHEISAVTIDTNKTLRVVKGRFKYFVTE